MRIIISTFEAHEQYRGKSPVKIRNTISVMKGMQCGTGTSSVQRRVCSTNHYSDVLLETMQAMIEKSKISLIGSIVLIVPE